MDTNINKSFKKKTSLTFRNNETFEHCFWRCEMVEIASNSFKKEANMYNLILNKSANYMHLDMTICKTDNILYTIVLDILFK